MSIIGKSSFIPFFRLSTVFGMLIAIFGSCRVKPESSEKSFDPIRYTAQNKTAKKDITVKVQEIPHGIWSFSEIYCDGGDRMWAKMAAAANGRNIDKSVLKSPGRA